MMNKTWKKHDIELRPGMNIRGKWHLKHYIIKRKLGEGAIGTVYLCDANGKKAALKISENSTSMTMEVNVLKSLAKVQGNRLGPYLLDIDDWISPQGVTYSFYVMEYVQGQPLDQFIQKHGHIWIGVFMLQLLEDLEHLHKSGWVFGDLKTDNLLVSPSPTRVRWIDVGGTTKIGRAIKEYTEFYDRGYWELGTRRAEPSYDLFAFAMVFISLFYPKHFEKGPSPLNTLIKKLDQIKVLKVYNKCFKKALLGKYQTSTQMKDDVSIVIQQAQKKKCAQTENGPVFLEAFGILAIAIGYYLSSLLIP